MTEQLAHVVRSLDKCTHRRQMDMKEVYTSALGVRPREVCLKRVGDQGGVDQGPRKA